MTPSKGTQFYYTFDPAHTAAVPASLPTVYPVAGADLTTWTQIECVQDVGGVDGIKPETVEHRCLDATQVLVEDYPTGFVKADPITLTPTYKPALEAIMRAAKLARTKLRLLMVMALDSTQSTRPDVFAWKCYCTMSDPTIDSGGKPVDLKLEFKLYDDTGVYIQGA